MQLPIKALALALLAGAAGAARAGFTTSAWLDASYDATQPLADGTVYFVTNSVTFEGAYDGRSGLAVAPGAEVVIYVRENCTLRASGTNAVQGGPGGGAGILCPSGSTLVVTGPGAVRAVGGNASDGEVRGRAIGGSFVDGDGDGESDTSRAGRGGKGGNGGGGAGAGIGGAGGAGGTGYMALVEDAVPNDPDTFDKNGASGFAGGNGGDGGSAGLVWLLGTATLEAKPGSGGVGGGGVEESTYLDHGAKRQFVMRWYFVGGGGMGGGGAGGTPAPGGIGGGGAGGGAGGSGGNGARCCSTDFTQHDRPPTGGAGYGGRSADGQRDGEDGWHDQQYGGGNPATLGGKTGGARGAAGAAGAIGAGGRLNVFATATFEGSVAGDASTPTNVAPDSVRYALSFESEGSVQVYLGGPIAAAPVPAPRPGHAFLGWYTQENGGGERWFAADGTPDFVRYETVGDTALHPAWTGAGSTTGFTASAWLDASYDATQPLANGTVYFVTNDVAFEGAYDGKSGLAVAPSAEVVIFVQEGCRLTAKGKGGDAGGAGGGAGILCPSNSTLIITGPGSVQATGGGGASGEGRGKASPGFIEDQTSQAGRGGKGGSGGAGAGAGIGGAGGSGGIGHEAPQENPKPTNSDIDADGLDGVAGGAGGDGGDAGLVWLLGTATLDASSGNGGGGGGGLDYSTQLDYGANRTFGFRTYYIGGGGMGGGGAGGAPAAGGIGGGGGGGGAGGSGGNGGYYCTTAGYPRNPSGGIGYGGLSADDARNGQDGWFDGDTPIYATENGKRGGLRGAAGAAGKGGTGGRLNIFPTAKFYGSVANDEKYGTFSAPDSVRYVLSFESAEPAKVYLGKPSSEIQAPVPKRFGKTFNGWFTAANGGGERWFDANGAADFGCYATVGDTTLYASWSDTPGFDPADYRLRADGIGIDGDEVVIPFHAEIPANLDYALDFVKVRSSPTLPILANGPAASATLETLEDGGKAMVVPFDPTAPSMFYRLDIDVED